MSHTSLGKCVYLMMYVGDILITNNDIARMS